MTFPHPHSWIKGCGRRGKDGEGREERNSGGRINPPLQNTVYAVAG